MKNSLLLSVQKFSVHDGPGIRTTLFFKGCPLHCAWCHNPESQAYSAELLYDREKCSACLACLPRCPAGAISAVDGLPVTDRKACRSCGRCVEFCLNDARSLAGSAVNSAELLQKICRDQIFYEESGGGVTFSGGEALTHLDVLEPLAAACKDRGLHTTVDTCGYAPTDAFRRILPYTDLFLYDLKHMDPDIHRHLTGQDNRLILDNLQWLSEAGADIFLRLPLMEGINAAPDQIEAFLAHIRPLRIKQVNLLPYHNTGSSKYFRLDREFSAFTAPSPQRLETIRTQFATLGVPTFIGG